MLADKENVFMLLYNQLDQVTLTHWCCFGLSAISREST